MLRAISTDTTHRRPVMQAHRARPASNAAAQEIEQQHRMEYIDFINRLMHRMKMDGIERMLDAALEQEIN
ncbi:MAG: hypothetical protein IJ313_05870 [Clostridia bacterium]|nr:hypothetical protein [Clostridia bacterium]